MALSVAGLALAQDAPQTDVLRGVVVDTDGAPVAGLAIDVLRHDGGDFTCLDLEFARELRKVTTLRTGKNGTFAFQAPRGLPYELRADDGVHAPIVRHGVYGGEDLRIALAAPASLVVTIVDAAGKPFSDGGFVRIWDSAEPADLRGPIDEHGVFRSDRLAAGSKTVAAQTLGAIAPEWQHIELSAGEQKTLEFTVQPGFVARGRVTDAGTGKPIAGARVGEGWTLYQPVLTDADGRYELRGFGAPTLGGLYVRAGGYGAAAVRMQNVDSDRRQDFTLEPGRAARGRIVAANGLPVVGAYVAAVGFARDEAGTFDWCPGRSDAEGRYELRGLRASVSYTLLVLPPDGVRLTYDLARADATRDLELADVQLVSGRYASGRVLDESGVPVAGMAVVLRGANVDRERLGGKHEDGAMVDNYVAVRVASTDGLGRIHFANVAPGRYVMEWFRGRERDSVPIEVAADTDPKPVKFTVSR